MLQIQKNIYCRTALVTLESSPVFFLLYDTHLFHNFLKWLRVVLSTFVVISLANLARKIYRPELKQQFQKSWRGEFAKGRRFLLSENTKKKFMQLKISRKCWSIRYFNNTCKTLKTHATYLFNCSMRYWKSMKTLAH